MSCRKVSRELLERFRFGEELDLRSDPHLAHLQSCATCRSEVGLDRALVVQLRAALHARIAGSSPSPRAWEAVRERALAIEAPQAWLLQAWRWLRLAPAAAAMSLMILAVAVAQDSDTQTVIPEPDWPRLERITSAQPDWEMPWWLAARVGPPAAPQARGPLDRAADDVIRVSRAGPFSEFVE
jgi:anti-sigma factor RsiW